MDEEPSLRAIQVVIDPKRPRMIQKDTIPKGESLAADFEKLAALLTDPCAVLVQFGDKATKNTDWVLIVWIPEGATPAVQSKWANCSTSIMGAMDGHRLMELAASDKAAVSAASIEAKGNEVLTMKTYDPKTTQEAWDNHFGAFGSQNVDKIMLDYTEDSLIRVFNDKDPNERTVDYKGLAMISKFFTDLFASLSNLETLKAPVVSIDEDPGHAFLAWSCSGCGFASATDTFIFDKDFKVVQQNIVVTTDATPAKEEKPPKVAAAAPPKMAEGEYKPTCVAHAWNNHFASFGGQDVAKCMLDYDDKSVVRTFNVTDGKAETHTGPKEIEAFFKGLFAALSDLTTLTAPIIEVDETAKQVFLCWRCPGMGFENGTDTFLFDSNFKVRRQNIVMTMK